MEEQDWARKCLGEENAKVNGLVLSLQPSPSSCWLSAYIGVSWFNPSQQLSTTQPLPPSHSQWCEEEERKKNVKLVG